LTEALAEYLGQAFVLYEDLMQDQEGVGKELDSEMRMDRKYEEVYGPSTIHRRMQDTNGVKYKST